MNENPEVPPKIAEAFARGLKRQGCELDFGLDSLSGTLEAVLEQRERWAGMAASWAVPEAGFNEPPDFDTACACYLGETLARAHPGKWRGFCTSAALMNYYSVYQLFGDYRFHPFTYINYRASNGVKDTGTVARLLEAITPSLRDGIDYKRQEQQRLIDQGKLVVDARPWT